MSLDGDEEVIESELEWIQYKNDIYGHPNHSSSFEARDELG